jgi:hypothetical protein
MDGSAVAGMHCVVPIRIRLVGRPTDDDLVRLEDAVARLVGRQLLTAQRSLQERGYASVGGEAQLRDRYDSAEGQAASPDDAVASYGRSAGNAAISRMVDIQRKPEEPPTPESIGVALGTIKIVSTTKAEVRSLRPWVIFETLPWNPSDGGKRRLFSALTKEFKALRKAKDALAEAVKREAAAPGAAAVHHKGKKGKKGAKPLTVAEAQAAVDRAKAKVDAATKALKEYVKGKLDSSRNPRTTLVRNEKKAAQGELRQLERQLRAAGRKKKPDPDAVADLTSRRDAAKAKVTAASAKLTALLTALQAEIDAADWTQQTVERTTTVHEVGDARVTLYDRVEAYATVTAEGFEGKAERTSSGGPTVPELLAKDATIGPSTRKILAIISQFEGGFTALNTWDIADVTFGMVQWTTGVSGKGDLMRALTIIKKTAPDAFAARLGRYGIDVDSAGLVVTRPDGTVLHGVPAAKAVQTDSKLAAVLSAAGTDPAIQAAELKAADEIEVKGALNSRLSVTFPAKDKDAKPTTVKIPVSALITSELGVGVLANHTVHGGFPGGKLQTAANAYVKSHSLDPTADIADWGPGVEAALVAAISTGADADRVSVMKAKLSASPGSFE